VFGSVTSVSLQKSSSHVSSVDSTSCDFFKHPENPACFMVAFVVFDDPSGLKETLANKKDIQLPKKVLNSGYQSKYRQYLG